MRSAGFFAGRAVPLGAQTHELSAQRGEERPAKGQRR